MDKFRIVLKFILFGLYCTIYGIGSLFIQALSKFVLRNDNIKTREILSHWISTMSALTLKMLGVKVSVQADDSVDLDDTYLVVSNHLGYLDVLILASIKPCAFVTSHEVKEMPFLGALTELAGCLYVERRNKSNLHNEIIELKTALVSDLSVGIFPEATSTNGTSVLRFRRPLFTSALETGRDILPITINYKTLDSKKIDTTNRDTVCWYGDMNFLPHFWNFLKLIDVDVELNLSEPIHVQGHTAQSLSELAHKRVSEKFNCFKESLDTPEESFSQDPLPGSQLLKHSHSSQ